MEKEVRKIFKFDSDRSFDERCEIVRQTPISWFMSYKERLSMLKSRFGL